LRRIIHGLDPLARLGRQVGAPLLVAFWRAHHLHPATTSGGRSGDEFISRAPGFVSSTLHRSLDGTKVTMYAQWHSAEDYESMRRDPGPLPFLEEALTIAKFEPGMYEIVRTFSPTDR
jgi:hypothetical protein